METGGAKCHCLMKENIFSCIYIYMDIITDCFYIYIPAPPKSQEIKIWINSYVLNNLFLKNNGYTGPVGLI